MPTVLIPALLRGLTGDVDRVEVEGDTLRKVINNLDERFPGTKARIVEDGLIRPEISVAVNGNIVAMGLLEPVPADAEVAIVPAISGGRAAEPPPSINSRTICAEAAMPELETTPLFDLGVTFAPGLGLGRTPQGTRTVVSITGGSFSGPDLRGEVLAGGGDWALRRADGAVALDVRVTLRTDDGALIYMAYLGLIAGPAGVMRQLVRGEDADPSTYYLRTTPRFETASDKYGWLNRIVAVASGALHPGRIDYAVHRVV
ncbi:MAG: DUF3237 family protein [Dehalococcoidia bacterium]